MQPKPGAGVRIDMDDVPDLRAFGTRLVQCVCAFVLGQATAWTAAQFAPSKFGRVEASLFAPAFLVIGLGCACGLAWYALFDAWRVRASRMSTFPSARVRRLKRAAPSRSQPRRP